MQDAGTGRHPLHIARDHAALAGGIAVRHLALVDNGDGFKAAMRMLPHTARRTSRRELGGFPGAIQQQNGLSALPWLS